MGIANFFWAKNLKDSIFKYGFIFSKTNTGVSLSSGGSNFSLDTLADFQGKNLCGFVLSISKYLYSWLKYK